MKSDYENSDLIRALLLLSLDASLPFYGELGVPMVAGTVTPPRMLDVLREALTFCGDTNCTAVLSRASDSLGPDVFGMLIWIDDVFPHDRNVWIVLEEAFGAAAQDFRRGHQDRIGLSSEVPGIYARFKKEVFEYDYETLEAAYSPVNLSPWDRSVLVRLAGDLNDQLRNPFADDAALCVRIYRFQRFWAGIRGQLKQNHHERLTTCIKSSKIFQWPTGLEVVDLQVWVK